MSAESSNNDGFNIEQTQEQTKEQKQQEEFKTKITEWNYKQDNTENQDNTDNQKEYPVSIDKVTEGLNETSELKNKLKTAIEQNIFKDIPDIFPEHTKKHITLAVTMKLVKDQEIQKNFINTVKDIHNFLNEATGQIFVFLNKYIKVDENLEPLSKNSGAITEVEDKFNDITKEYNEKFIDLNKKLDEYQNDEGIKLTDEEKQKIISNIPFFQNPATIEDINNLKIDYINNDFIEKNKDNLNNEIEEDNIGEISKYLSESQSELKNLSEQITAGNLGDRIGDKVYDILNQPQFGKETKNVLSHILKIPIIGALLGKFLGLNGETPEEMINSLNENTKNYKLFKGFKGLGYTKKLVQPNNSETDVAGKGIFETTDMSKWHFNDFKEEIKQIKELNPKMDDLNEENLGNFWLEAFGGENGEGTGLDLIKDDIEFKLNLKVGLEKDKIQHKGKVKEAMKTGIENAKEDIQHAEETKAQEAQKTPNPSATPKQTATDIPSQNNSNKNIPAIQEVDQNSEISKTLEQISKTVQKNIEGTGVSSLKDIRGNINYKDGNISSYGLNTKLDISDFDKNIKIDGLNINFDLNRMECIKIANLINFIKYKYIDGNGLNLNKITLKGFEFDFLSRNLQAKFDGQYYDVNILKYSQISQYLKGLPTEKEFIRYLNSLIKTKS